MRARRAASHPDWVPGRLARYDGRPGSTRWLIQRPERLLGWWFFGATLLPLLGALLTLVGLPWSVVVVWGFLGWVQVGVDFVYIPRAFRAWRQGAVHPTAAGHRRSTDAYGRELADWIDECDHDVDDRQ